MSLALTVVTLENGTILETPEPFESEIDSYSGRKAILTLVQYFHDHRLGWDGQVDAVGDTYLHRISQRPERRNWCSSRCPERRQTFCSTGREKGEARDTNLPILRERNQSICSRPYRRYGVRSTSSLWLFRTHLSRLFQPITNLQSPPQASPPFRKVHLEANSCSTTTSSRIRCSVSCWKSDSWKASLKKRCEDLSIHLD